MPRDALDRKEIEPHEQRVCSANAPPSESPIEVRGSHKIQFARRS